MPNPDITFTDKARNIKPTVDRNSSSFCNFLYMLFKHLHNYYFIDILNSNISLMNNYIRFGHFYWLENGGKKIDEIFVGVKICNYKIKGDLYEEFW
jgi:hypothetical protein